MTSGRSRVHAAGGYHVTSDDATNGRGENQLHGIVETAMSPVDSILTAANGWPASFFPRGDLKPIAGAFIESNSMSDDSHNGRWRRATGCSWTSGGRNCSISDLVCSRSAPYEDVSIDEIAAEAEISKGLLYHYFKNKRGFYVAVIERAAGQLLAATAPDETLEPEARVLAGLSAYFDFLEDNKRAYVAVMQSGGGVDAEVSRIVQQTREEFVARMIEGVGLTAPRPVFRMVAHGWFGTVEAVGLDYLKNSDVDRSQVMQTLLYLLYHFVAIGIRLDPESGVELEGDPP